MPRADQGTLSLPGRATGQPNPEAIARRAYELYQQRGGEAGHEIEDWLQAEAELAARGEDVRPADLGNTLEGKPAGAPASAPAASSGGTSGAPARKGNSSRRPQRQPQSH